MSFSTTRTSLAAALSTVAGVTGYTKKPSVWSPGDALVLVERIDSVQGVAWQCTWRIVLMLPGDQGAAIEQFDDLFPEICEAVRHEVFVDSATPQEVATDNGPMTGVVILARSE